MSELWRVEHGYFGPGATRELQRDAQAALRVPKGGERMLDHAPQIGWARKGASSCDHGLSRDKEAGVG